MSESRTFKLPYIFSFLCALGFALALISLYHHTAINNGVDLGKSAFCNISATINCDSVNKSGFSYVFGIPIASYGIWFYISLAVFSFLMRDAGLIARSTAASVCFTLATLAALFSIVLFGISELVIHALCPTCLAMYGVNLILLLSSWFSERETPVAARLTSGVKALLAIPKLLCFPPSKELARTARLTAFAFALTAYGAVTLPDVLLFRLLLPREVAKGEHEIVAAGVEEWLKSPTITIPGPDASSAATVDYSMGATNAPIQVVEFSDFECPYCRQLYVGMDQLFNDYSGKIHFVFKNFPIDNSCNPKVDHVFHHSACRAAIFARCAGEQGKFWEAASFLFTLPEFDNDSPKEKVASAINQGIGTLALDAEGMKECINSPRPRDKMASDVEQAFAVGIEGTPFVIVNNRVVKTPTPEVLRAIFDMILKRPPSP